MIKDSISYNILTLRGLGNLLWTFKMYLKGTGVDWDDVFKDIRLDLFHWRVNE